LAPWRLAVSRSLRATSSSFVAARPPPMAALVASRRGAMAAPAGRSAGARRVWSMAVVADAEPVAPRRLKGVHKPVAVTGPLLEFAGVPISTRPELIRAISAYVKKANLQLAEDKRYFKVDPKLRKILGVDACAFLSISKYLTPHLKKPEDVSPALAKQASEMVDAANAAADKFEAETPYDDDEVTGKKSYKRKAKKNSNKALGPARAKEEGTGIFRPLKLSKTLSKVCGAETLSRPEAVKAMWRYIKLNKLQSPGDGRVIICDSLLKELFGCDKTDAFAMNKLLTPHLSKM